jgi:hypothetical protein
MSDGPGHLGHDGAMRPATALLLACVPALFVLAVFVPPASAASSPICSAAPGGAVLHVTVSSGPFASQTGHDLGISGLEVVNLLPSVCDSQPVAVEFWGNVSGDDTAPAALLLSLAQSDLDPCTQQALPAPALVSAGRVNLALCERGGPARFADLRELTRVTLFVADVEVPMSLGLTAQGSMSGGTPARGSPAELGSNAQPVHGTAAQGSSGGRDLGSSSGDSTGSASPVGIPPPGASGILPFTGTSAEWLIWLGLLVMATGVGFTTAARRRGSSRS